jgi:peptidyl-tRNA hydrolase, PTH1 family
MNVSGKAVANAYNSFVRNLPEGERDTARLVVLHDELEAPLGKIKMKAGGSARGHNGIKSVVEAMRGREFVRIGVGIGRPESRDSKDVADYVLKKMKPAEIEKVRDGASEVLRILERLRDG